MKRKKVKNPVAADLRTPKYRIRVEKSKQLYNKKAERQRIKKALAVIKDHEGLFVQVAA
mgnify:CR=1 FL=1|jgi:hypothetical protein